jgi:hypothetical protein
MKNLSNSELVQINGGSEATHQSGLNAGRAVRQWISETADSIGNLWDILVH